MTKWMFASAFLLTLVAATVSAQPCTPVTFDEARQGIGPQNGVGEARIVVHSKDMTLDNLICLRQGLKARHPDWRNVTVLVFSSKQAAVAFEVDKIASSGVVGAFDREVRAAYWLGGANESDTLTLMPLGWELLQDGDYNTVVEFPAQRPPRCRAESNRRCVLALERIRYPPEALRHNVSGAVVVAGKIDKAGHTFDGRIVDAGDRSTQKDFLAQAALANLKTWRLEPVTREEAFRVTFSYSVDASLSGEYVSAIAGLRDRFRREGITRVEFGTNHVRMRGALPE